MGHSRGLIIQRDVVEKPSPHGLAKALENFV